MEWAWSTLGAERLISLIHPDNDRSVRVAERLGLGRLRDDVLAGTPVVVFGLERPR
jgi:RimJ/RimL family protein N-acetyltransferase